MMYDISPPPKESLQTKVNTMTPLPLPLYHHNYYYLQSTMFALNYLRIADTHKIKASTRKSLLTIGLANGLCEQFVYFCEHEKLLNSSFEKYRWRAASSEHLVYFVNFSLAGISLSLIGNVVL